MVLCYRWLRTTPPPPSSFINNSNSGPVPTEVLSQMIPIQPTEYILIQTTEDILENLDSIAVEGGSICMCNFVDTVERVEVFLKTTGRPLNLKV